MSDVTIFAPSPTLTVTVEEHPDGDEIHIHTGGQGVWQARMLLRFDVSVTLCCVLTGETGAVARHLLEDEGITVAAVTRDGRGSAYLHDRRGGERVEIAEEEGDALGRHELDEVYSLMIREGLASKLVILSGPGGDDVLPADTYRRLAADLREAGATVIADLAGERLAAAVDGGVDVLKVSDDELQDDGLADSDDDGPVIAAMRALRDRGARTVIVTRAHDPLLLLDEEGVLEVTPPSLEVTDTRGAGDSLVAGVVAGLVRGESVRDAITLGAAAGALNVTRHGLGTGDPDAIAQLRETVTVRELTGDETSPGAGGRPPGSTEDSTADAADEPSGRVSPDGLARLAEPAGSDDPGGSDDPQEPDRPQEPQEPEEPDGPREPQEPHGADKPARPEDVS